MTLLFVLLLVLSLSGLTMCCLILVYYLKNKDFPRLNKRSVHRIPPLQNANAVSNSSLIQNRRYHSSHNWFFSKRDENDDDVLPNGYTRQDYRDVGWLDVEIECWGFDQPAAPSPTFSGFVVADMMDGKIDGNFDFPFT